MPGALSESCDLNRSRPLAPFTQSKVGLRAAIPRKGLSDRSGHGVAAADIDAGGGEGAVRLLGGGGGRDGGTGFKLAAVGDLQTLNRHVRADDELFLHPAVL